MTETLPRRRRPSRTGMLMVVVGVVATMWFGWLFVRGGPHGAERRREVISCIEGLRPLSALSSAARDCLVNEIGWSEADRGFYEAYFAVPEPKDIAEWMTARPRDRAEWAAWSREATTSGVSVQAIGIASRERTLGLKAYEAAVVDRSVSMSRQARLAEAVRSALSGEIESVVAMMRRRDWGDARRALRECGGIEAQLQMDEVLLEVLRKSGGSESAPRENGK